MPNLNFGTLLNAQGEQKAMAELWDSTLSWLETTEVSLGRFRRVDQMAIYEVLGVRLELTSRPVVSETDGLMLELELWIGDGDSRKSLLTWYLASGQAIYTKARRMREAWLGKLGDDWLPDRIAREFTWAADQAGAFSPKHQ